MKLPDQLGTLGDHAYRASAYTREPTFDQKARTELSLCLLLIESIAPQLREMLGVRERATPIPPKPDPAVEKKAKRKIDNERRADPDPMTIERIKAEIRAKRKP